jgi:hypothetical protein
MYRRNPMKTRTTTGTREEPVAAWATVNPPFLQR